MKRCIRVILAEVLREKKNFIFISFSLKSNPSSLKDFGGPDDQDF